MPGAIIETFPDRTGCAHSAVGLSSPSPRKVGNFEVGYCLDCKCEIAFTLQSGNRTGETRIVQIREVSEEDRSS